MSEREGLAERDERFRKLREAMRREGLGAVVVAGRGSMFNRGYVRYYANTHLWAGESLIIIPLEDDPVHVQVTFSGAQWPEPLWVEDVRRAPHPSTEIAKAMREKNLARGKIGIAGFHRIITMGAYQTLTSSFPDVEFVSADLMVNRLRAIKSPLELRQYRDLWNVARAAMERFVEVIRSAGSFHDMTCIYVGEYRGLPRDLSVNCTDIVALHMEICGESGHWVEIEATCAFRQPTAVESKLMESELRAYDVVREMAKPGVKLSDMAQTFDRVLMEEGWELGEPIWHYYFHGQGMDDIEWPWYSAMLEDNEDAVLEEGMVINYHPHPRTIPEATHDPAITDNIVIRANGAERLSGDWNPRWRIM
jgi:Xaa-Pro aminopeptidase